MKKEINGIIRFKRGDTSDCICCEGNHIFCRYISELDTDKNIILNKAISALLEEDKNENKKIKIIVKVQDENMITKFIKNILKIRH